MFFGVMLIILLELLIDAKKVLLKEAVWIKFLDICGLCRGLLRNLLKSDSFWWLGGPNEPSHFRLGGQNHDFFWEELRQDYLFSGSLLKIVDNVFYYQLERRILWGIKNFITVVDLKSLPPVELMIEKRVLPFVNPSVLDEWTTPLFQWHFFEYLETLFALPLRTCIHEVFVY